MSTDDPISFSRPKIGPKVYLAKGPSGWNQTFPRDAADKALARFIGPLQLDELVDLFNLQREVNQTPADWFTIVGFLGRTMQVHPNMVPHEVGVSFWAKTIVALEAKGAN